MCVLGFSARGDEGKGCPRAESPQPPRDPQPKTQHNHSRQEKKRKKKKPPAFRRRKHFFYFFARQPRLPGSGGGALYLRGRLLKVSTSRRAASSRRARSAGRRMTAGRRKPARGRKKPAPPPRRQQPGHGGRKTPRGGLRACPQSPPPSKRPPELAPRERD